MRGTLEFALSRHTSLAAHYPTPWTPPVCTMVGLRLITLTPFGSETSMVSALIVPLTSEVRPGLSATLKTNDVMDLEEEFEPPPPLPESDFLQEGMESINKRPITAIRRFIVIF